MEKTRVNKGEIYFYIWADCYLNFEVHYAADFWGKLNNHNFEKGNYFHTAEEAESMASKLRAVLKGADVIEMPSEEEIVAESKKFEYPPLFKAAMNWLKSKIVK